LLGGAHAKENSRRTDAMHTRRIALSVRRQQRGNQRTLPGSRLKTAFFGWSIFPAPRETNARWLMESRKLCSYSLSEVWNAPHFLRNPPEVTVLQALPHDGSYLLSLSPTKSEVSKRLTGCAIRLGELRGHSGVRDTQDERRSRETVSDAGYFHSDSTDDAPCILHVPHRSSCTRHPALQKMEKSSKESSSIFALGFSRKHSI